MVTRPQLDKLAGRVEAVAAPVLNPIVTVTVFSGETEDTAMSRHAELRPDHVGRRVQFRHLPQEERPECSDVEAGYTFTLPEMVNSTGSWRMR